MNRKRDQAELYFKLGQLFGPMLKVAENPDSYDSDDRTRIQARFCAEVTTAVAAIDQYCQGEPGHVYASQSSTAKQQIYSLRSLLPNDAIQSVKALSENCFNALFSIPVPIESAIHEAHTPFSTYYLLRDICSTARQRIVWIDRYFDQTIFRYFWDTPLTAPITLVTWPKTQFIQARDIRRYDDFMDASRLFAQQHGPNAYRLIIDDQIHARFLQVDGTMLALPDSVKDLGSGTTFTISKLDSTRKNQDEFDEPIKRGTEVFGPKQRTHP
jgi:hypothetical protein